MNGHDENDFDIPVAKQNCSVCGQPLGDAGVADLKARYRKLAKEHHPDRGGDAAQFRALKSVYDELLQRPEVKSVDDVWGRCEGLHYPREARVIASLGVAPRN